jgi:hypothetical protein
MTRSRARSQLFAPTAAKLFFATAHALPAASIAESRSFPSLRKKLRQLPKPKFK